MKILLVTPVNPQLENQKPLPVWQAQNFWRLALIKLGHKVKVFRLNDFPKNKLLKTWQLQRLVRRYKPKEIFFSAGVDRVFPIKKTVFFSGVPPRTLSSHERLTGIKAKLVVTNDPSHNQQWEKLGAKKAICLPISAVEPSYFHPAEKEDRSIPISFVGTLFPDRQILLQDLVKVIPQLQIWGWLPPRAKLLSELKPHYQGEAWAEQVVRIYQQSKIGLNLAPVHLPLAGNLRTFEIPACRALMLTDKNNPDWYQPNQDVVVFRKPEEAAGKTQYYLSHPEERLKLAQSGYQQTISRHTYFQRFKKLLKLCPS
jgi:spore maturation protein CgeB